MAAASGATAVHPGYGFLSESAAFAAAVEGARLAWVGPPSAAIAALGDKASAKELMAAAGVLVVPGYHGADQSDAALVAAAAAVGFPVLVKAVAGGGGKGMKAAHTAADLPAAIASARREAAAAFGNDRLLVERLVVDPRHIEVQILADAHGHAVHLHERDCSVQRRHQKVLEEAPAPGLPAETRAALGAAAVRAAQAAGYVGAGTVEFLVDGVSGDAFFLEVNARLQVEHPVTEGVTTVTRGRSPPQPLDLVEAQLRAAAGEPLGFDQAGVRLVAPGWCAVEARLYAERPEAGFLPAAGTVSAWRPPPGAFAFQWGGEGGGGGGEGGGAAAASKLRLDASLTAPGAVVGVSYDPMVGKLLARGPSRAAALTNLRAGLASLRLGGLPTNVGLLWRIAGHPAFAASGGDGPAVGTGFLAEHGPGLVCPPPPPPASVAVVAVARHLLGAAAAAGPASASLPRPTPCWGAWSGAASARPVSGLPARRAVRLALPSYRCVADLELEFSSAPAPAAGGAPGSSVRVTGDVVPAPPPPGGWGGSEGAADAPPHPPLVVDVTLVGPGLHPPAPGDTSGLWTLTTTIAGRAVRADVGVGTDGDGLVLNVWGADPGEAGGGVDARVGLARRWARTSANASSDPSSSPAAAPALSPMPGRVVKLCVGVGDAVARGDPVAVLEAMKMEHAVLAPCDGVVSAVGVGVGSLVATGEEIVWVGGGEGGAAAAEVGGGY